MDDDWNWGTFWKWAFRSALILLVIGIIILAFTGFFGTILNQIDSNLFNSSKEHQQAVEQLFATDCKQLAEATNQQTRLAIENEIYINASTVDLKQLNMPDSTRTCVNNAIKDVTHSK